jgi:hypothetical protein
MIRKYAIIVFMVILSSCEPNTDVNTTTLRLYGDALEDIGYSIAKTDNGYIIGGQFTEVSRDGSVILTEKSSKKLGIIRTDADGKEIWKHSYGDELVDAVGSKVITLTDGSFIATGYKIDTTKNDTRDVFVVKVSADGLTSTEKTYKEDGNQYGIDILQTTEGFIVLGSTDVARTGTADSIGNAAGKKDIYLLRINNNLEPLAAPETFGYPGNDAAVSIKNDVGGGYVIVGTTDYSWPKQALNNIFILKTNLSGRPNKGIRLLGSADDEYASDVEILEDGYLIAGIVGSDGSDQSVYLTKIPADIFSSIVYTRKFKVSTTASTATSFAVRAISRYSTDQFVLAGQAGTGASAKMLIFIVDAEGNQVPGKEMITTATGTQVAYDVISDNTDNIIAVGKNSFENNSLISFLKIRF